MARVAVIGAGTMGQVPALALALDGHRVRPTDSGEATADGTSAHPAQAIPANESHAPLPVRGRSGMLDRRRVALEQAMRVIGAMAGLERGA